MSATAEWSLAMAVSAWVASAAMATSLDACVGEPPGDCSSHFQCAPPKEASDDTAEPDATTEAAADRDAGGDVLDGLSDVDAVACDPSKSPRDDACVIADAYAVFVSPSGHDAAAGTMGDPLKTVTEGMAKAVQVGKPRVYVCQGKYSEQVTLDAAHDGVSLFGGLDCANGWLWTGSKAQVLGPGALFALRVDQTQKPVVIEDMGFAVLDAAGRDDAGAGQSSVAAFVSNEDAGVTLQRVALRAGNGSDGASGSPPPTNWYSPDASDLQGYGALGATGAAARDCPCKTWGDTQGGAGGDAGSPTASNGGTGISAPSAVPSGNSDGHGGAGYPGGSLGVCLPGRAGASGGAQTVADAGTGTLGTLGGGSWLPARGNDGLPGDPGQGGGGGGGGQSAGGGGGGCGGCGGAGGLGGGGGGASIALLLSDAVVDLRETALATGRGGKGGNASTGESGGGGGGGGTIGACGGGVGGNGAGGQGGGGGSGGASVGVLSSSSSRVTMDSATTFTLGTFGAGGAAGMGGAGGSNVNGQAPSGGVGAKGVDGVSSAQLLVP
jgi:hypothetical protein